MGIEELSSSRQHSEWPAKRACEGMCRAMRESTVELPFHTRGKTLFLV